MKLRKLSPGKNGRRVLMGVLILSMLACYGMYRQRFLYKLVFGTSMRADPEFYDDFED